MSGFRLVSKLLAVVVISAFLSVSSKAYVKDIDAKTFERGVEQFKVGSYYSAIDYFSKLTANPESPYFNRALLMLSKVYLKIGKKTGEKKFLWRSLSYLQLYFLSRGKGDWEYYFTKANIFESLKFYERALNLYRISFLKTNSDEKKIKTTIGIIRTSVFLRKNQIFKTYLILISTSKLQPEEEKEVQFIKGLALFHEGKYKKAIRYFMKTYRQYESYLLDNPEYYFLVAENLYRAGNLKLSEQLFRRIISLTRDKSTIRKALLRLGDIELNKGNEKLATTYYYSVISDYKGSDEAIVARLKCISLLDNPIVRYRLSKTEEEAFKDPVKYIAKTLVIYRDTYIGLFALADLGKLVFELKSKPLFDRLSWELSLIFPEQIKFEQREFISRLWAPFIEKTSHSRICQLYRANPGFFEKVFDRDILISISKKLKQCGERKLRLKLLKFIVNKWKDEESKLMLAQALFEVKDFNSSLSILSNIKKLRNCFYYKLLCKNLIFSGKRTDNVIPDLSRACGDNDTEVIALNILKLVNNRETDTAFKLSRKFKESLINAYRENPTVKVALNKLIERLILESRYTDSLAFLNPLTETTNNCLLNSLSVIALTRTDKMEAAGRKVQLIENCKDSISKVASIIYNSERILRRKDGYMESSE